MLRRILILGLGLSLSACGGSEALTITTASLNAGALGQAYQATVAATGGSGEGYKWSVTGNLPAGLTLAAEGTPSAVISGTPESSGRANFTVKVEDSDGNTASQALSINVPVEGALSISTTALGRALLGQAFSAEIRADGGSGAGYIWEITQGTLPDGLMLAATGSPATLLSGTAIEVGDFSFTVQVTDGSDTATADLTLTVNESLRPLNIETETLAPGDVGVAYIAEVAAIDGTGMGYSWSIISGALPDGLALAAAGTPNSQITGTPTSFGTYTFEVAVEDSSSARATKQLTIEVQPGVLVVATSTLPQGSATAAYSASITALGGSEAGYVWSISAGALPQGLTLQSAGTPSAQLSGTPAAFGTFDFTVSVTDSMGASTTRALSLVIQPALSIPAVTFPRGRVGQVFTATVVASDGAGAGHQWTVTGGTLPVGLSLSTPNAQVLTVSGTPTEFGTFVLLLGVTDAHGGVASVSLTLEVDPVAVQIITSMLPAGVMNQAYTASVDTTDGTGVGYTWAAGTLPAGLVLAAAGAPSTQIAGVPTEFGTFTATVSVTDTNGDRHVQTLSVDIAPPPVFITTVSVPDGVYGVPYSAPVVGELGSLVGYTWSISQGSLPIGLQLVADGAPATVISGNPEEEGTFSFTVLLTDANGEIASVALSMTVTRNLAIETRALAAAEVGVAYTSPLQAAGGAPPYVWSLSAGALPAGLSLVGSDIVGMPTVLAPARFTVQVQDGDGTVVERDFMLSPRGLQQWAAAIGDTVDNNEGLVVLVDVVGAPTGFVTVNPPATGFGDASTDRDDASFAPNNSKVAFIGDFLTDGVNELFVVDLAGGIPGGPVRVNGAMPATGDVLDFKWSPDSQQIIYVADPNTDAQNELFIVDVSGATPGIARQISPAMVAGGDISQDDYWFSPDGRWVVMLADVRIDNTLELFIAEVLVTDQVVAAHAPLDATGDTDDNVQFVPDGSGLVFRSDVNAPNLEELFYVDLSGATPGPSIQLNGTLPTGGDVELNQYGISPDGRRLFYVADQNRDAQRELFGVRLNLFAPGAPVRLNPTLTGAGMDVLSAVWSPDSNRIAYISDELVDNETELFVIDVSGQIASPSNRVSAPLVGVGRDVQSAAGTSYGWSLDGQSIAYRADSVVDNALDLFLVRMSGATTTATVTRLNGDLLGSADVDNFLFSPDSQRIVFRGDLNLVSQQELFSVDISGAFPAATQQVNGTMAVGGDVDNAAEQLRWSRDSTRIFYRADEVVNNDTGSWVSDVSGVVPLAPQLTSPGLPAGGDVSFFILQQ